MEFFPALMQRDAQALTEPLALLYRHLDPDDLEDADELLEEIESLEPPADLAEAVEGLVRATLLLADVEPAACRRPPSRRRAPRRRGRCHASARAEQALRVQPEPGGDAGEAVAAHRARAAETPPRCAAPAAAGRSSRR